MCNFCGQKNACEYFSVAFGLKSVNSLQDLHAHQNFIRNTSTGYLLEEVNAYVDQTNNILCEE